ncbi:MAG: hypothetical protein AAF517_24250 [Planctomycetota bacterium]
MRNLLTFRRDPLNPLDAPFYLRVLFLIALGAGVVAFERFVLKRQTRRASEYVFLVGCALVGAAFGVLNDQITCSISPEYFVLGKEIDAGDGFRWRVAALGAKAGVCAGAIAGGTLLISNTLGFLKPARELRALWRFTVPPLALAVLGAGVGSVAFPPLLSSAFIEGIEPDARPSFLAVWGVHLGLYAGATLGLLVASLRLRFSASPAKEPPSVS